MKVQQTEGELRYRTYRSYRHTCMYMCEFVNLMNFCICLCTCIHTQMHTHSSNRQVLTDILS